MSVGVCEPIPCLVGSPRVWASLRASVQGSTFRLMPVLHLEDLLTNDSGAWVCLIVPPRPEDVHDTVRLIRARLPRMDIVLAWAREQERTLQYPAPLDVEFLVWNGDGAALQRALQRAWMRGWRDRVRSTLSHNLRIPPIVRTAMVRSLYELPDPAFVGSAAPVRTQTHAARLAGISRSHLSTLLARFGVDFQRLADGWLAVSAVTLKEAHRIKWEAVARLCGYATLSGLSDLFLRVAGCRLRDLPTTDPVPWARWFEADMLTTALHLGEPRTLARGG